MSPKPEGGGAQEPASLSSVDLLERAQAGDREALEILFARYLPALKRWTTGRLPRWARDISETPDLVQDTLLQTFKRIELFQPECEGAAGFRRLARPLHLHALAECQG